jgi:general secretion pathway protein C
MKYFLGLFFLIAFNFSFAKEKLKSISGFKILRIEKDSVYEKLGFKKGDIIQSINGEPVTSVETFQIFYEKLKAENKLNISIKRNGQIQKLSYDIK